MTRENISREASQQVKGSAVFAKQQQCLLEVVRATAQTNSMLLAATLTAMGIPTPQWGSPHLLLFTYTTQLLGSQTI